MKEDLEDTSDSYDKVMKKNKKLHEEINDLQHTVQESSRNIHELEKEKRSVDQERAELQIAIKECEEAIKKQENKSIEAQVELSKVKQEAESKILEKNHMIADVRKITGAELDKSQGEGLKKSLRFCL